METGQKTIQKSSKIDKNLNSELSIQVSLNGLSFCILDTFKNAIIYYKTITFNNKQTPHKILEELKSVLDEDEMISTDFHKLNIIHDNELSTVVPKPLFNEDCIADYLKFNSRILRTDFITYDDIVTNDSVNVYIPYVNINNYIYDRFGEFVYRHYSTILIVSLLRENKNSNGKKMYVHKHSNSHFEIIVIDNGKLLLYNTFECTSKEDYIYYILFTAEQLELNPEEFTLYLLGNIKDGDEFYTITFKYVRHVNIVNPSTQYNIEDEAKEASSDYILLNSF